MIIFAGIKMEKLAAWPCTVRASTSDALDGGASVCMQQGEKGAASDLIAMTCCDHKFDPINFIIANEYCNLKNYYIILVTFCM